jgi:hypothetical protein
MAYEAYGMNLQNSYWYKIEQAMGARKEEATEALMERDVRIKILQLIWDEPEVLGHMVGFTDGTPMHGQWIKKLWDNLQPGEDRNMMAHRGSLKTSFITQVGSHRDLIFNPHHRIAIFRPAQHQSIDITRVVRNWYNLPPIIALLTEAPLHFSLKELTGKEKSIKWGFMPPAMRSRKEGNLDSWGMLGTTGYHYDIMVICDIATIDDRTSRAKREKTKAFVREVRNNIKDPNANVLMEGTTWHPEDVWSEWPADFKVNVYQSGLRTDDQITKMKDGYINKNGEWVPGLTAVEFGCNQMLEHLNSEDQIFGDPAYGKFVNTQQPSYMHVDAKYKGDHTGAITLLQKRTDGLWSGRGWVFDNHVDEQYDFIVTNCMAHNVRVCYMEENADKGLVIRDLVKLGRKKRCKTKFRNYNESTEKHTKIQSWGKRYYNQILWDDKMQHSINWRGGPTVPNGHAYINQVIMYMDGEDLNDGPDSMASLLREIYDKKGKGLW